MARLLTFKSVRHARRPFKSAAAWPHDIRLMTGATPNPICIGPAWPDMVKKNDCATPSSELIAAVILRGEIHCDGTALRTAGRVASVTRDCRVEDQSGRS